MHSAHRAAWCRGVFFMPLSVPCTCANSSFHTDSPSRGSFPGRSSYAVGPPGASSTASSTSSSSAAVAGQRLSASSGMVGVFFSHSNIRTLFFLLLWRFLTGCFLLCEGEDDHQLCLLFLSVRRSLVVLRRLLHLHQIFRILFLEFRFQVVL